MLGLIFGYSRCLIHETPDDSDKQLIARLSVADATDLQAPSIFDGYANHLLDANTSVSMAVEANMNIYCNCYVNKTLVFFTSAFPFSLQNFSFLTLHC